jgi:hypothetical protein
MHTDTVCAHRHCCIYQLSARGRLWSHILAVMHQADQPAIVAHDNVATKAYDSIICVISLSLGCCTIACQKHGVYPLIVTISTFSSSAYQHLKSQHMLLPASRHSKLCYRHHPTRQKEPRALSRNIRHSHSSTL